jgi:hypothetical protein
LGSGLISNQFSQIVESYELGHESHLSKGCDGDVFMICRGFRGSGTACSTNLAMRKCPLAAFPLHLSFKGQQMGVGTAPTKARRKKEEGKKTPFVFTRDKLKFENVRPIFRP